VDWITLVRRIITAHREDRKLLGAWHCQLIAGRLPRALDLRDIPSGYKQNAFHELLGIIEQMQLRKEPMDKFPKTIFATIDNQGKEDECLVVDPELKNLLVTSERTRVGEYVLKRVIEADLEPAIHCEVGQ
jgi:hypothetical protein